MDDFSQKYTTARRKVIERDFARMNDRQREAVMATEGPLLVLAGAGSGKTTVLINRVANLVKYGRGSDSDELPPNADEQGLSVMRAYLGGDDSLRAEAEARAALDPVEPWRILAITFTNKAADQLRERLSDMLGTAADGVWARTFHSACVRILRREAERIGYPSAFVIYDTADSTAVVKRILKEQNKDEKSFPPKWVLSVMERARDSLQTPDDLKRQADKSGDARLRGAAEIYAAYARRLREAGAMDFEDLIYQTVRLLQEHPDVLEYYQNKFRYVLIDEYQDTNHLQYLLAQLLAGGRDNLCVVGDDDQSIYAFRGATIENILSFESRYGKTRVIRLEQNYRSTGHILDAANGVVKNNHSRRGKRLWTEAGAGDRIVLYVARNEEDEARYIVQRVLSAVNQGARLGDHAVLYRLNAQSRALEQAFLRNGVRPRIVKGNPFFERAEIRDIMAYFFVLLNPADELRLARIVNVPARGIGATTMDRARSIAAESGLPLFTVLSIAGQFPELKRAADKLAAFVGMMNELSAMTQTAGLDELYDALLEKTGYARMLSASGSEEDLNRLENVRELKSFIVTYITQTGDNSLAGFLDEVSLYTDLQSASPDEDTVTLMTIHSAKGLEFPTVFIAGMEEGVFPSLQAIGETAQMEEERRLAYVAITRAKRRLYITSARQRMVFGTTASHRVSRFVDEIPPEHIDRPYSDFTPAYADFIDPEEFTSRAVNPTQKRAARKPSLGALTARKAAPKVNYAIGDRIRHSAFGEGVIRSMTPMGGDHLVQIEFQEAGMKKFLLKTASVYMEKL